MLPNVRTKESIGVVMESTRHDETIERLDDVV